MSNKYHAKVGQTIKIVDCNGADWIRLGNQYVVEDVDIRENSIGEVLYKFRGVDGRWCGAPSHFEIMSDLLKEAAVRYPVGTYYLGLGREGFCYNDYDMQYVSNCDPKFWNFEPSRDREVYVERGKGLVYTKGTWAPIVHKEYRKFKEGDVVVRWRDIEDWEWNGIGEATPPPIGKSVIVGALNDAIGFKSLPYFYADSDGSYYPTTAFVLEKHYKTNRGTAELNTTDYGKDKDRSIEVQRSTTSVVTGERRTGSTIQGRGDAAIVRRGHSSNKTIFGI